MKNQYEYVSRAHMLQGATQFYASTKPGTPAYLAGRWATVSGTPRGQYYTVTLWLGSVGQARWLTKNLAAARDAGRNWARVKGDGCPPMPCADCGDTFETALAPDGAVVCRGCLPYHQAPFDWDEAQATAETETFALANP